MAPVWGHSDGPHTILTLCRVQGGKEVCLPVCEEEDVVEEVVDFGGGLQQRHERGEVHVVRRVAQVLHHRIRRRAVQPRADLIHQQHFLRQAMPRFVSRVPAQRAFSSLHKQ